MGFLRKIPDTLCVLKISARRGLQLFTLSCCVLIPASQGLAHVGASESGVNRYYRLGVWADRAVLSVRIFFGDEKGGELRQTYQIDGKGRLSKENRQRFQFELERTLRQALEIGNNSDTSFHWRKGHWDYSASGKWPNAISFEYQLIHCLAGTGSSEVLQLRDQYPLEEGGESELRFDIGRGTKLENLQLGQVEIDTGNKSFSGESAREPLGEGLRFRVKSLKGAALGPKDGHCGTVLEPKTPATYLWMWLGASVLALLVFLSGAWVLLARRRSVSEEL